MTFLSHRLTGAEGPFFYSLLGLYCLKTVLSLHCGMLHLLSWCSNHIFCAVWLGYLQNPFQNFLLVVKSHPRPITSNGINGFEKSKEEATRYNHNTKSSHDLSVVTLCLGLCFCQNKEDLACGSLFSYWVDWEVQWLLWFSSLALTYEVWMYSYFVVLCVFGVGGNARILFYSFSVKLVSSGTAANNTT